VIECPLAARAQQARKVWRLGGTTGRYAAGAVEREFISLLGGAAATWPINFKPNQFRRQVGKSVDFSLCPSNLEHYVTAVHVAEVVQSILSGVPPLWSRFSWERRRRRKKFNARVLRGLWRNKLAYVVLAFEQTFMNQNKHSSR
jgi:hypothetical protein